MRGGIGESLDEQECGQQHTKSVEHVGEILNLYMVEWQGGLIWTLRIDPEDCRTEIKIRFGAQLFFEGFEKALVGFVGLREWRIRKIVGSDKHNSIGTFFGGSG